MNKQNIDHEKLLFLYSCALEDGDFATIQDILAQAEQDAELTAQLQEIEVIYEPDLQLPRARVTYIPLPENRQISTNGYRGNIALEPQAMPTIQTKHRGKNMMRIAILIITLFGSLFTYLGTYNSDSPIIVTEIPAGQSATMLPQAERVSITAENADQLAVLANYGDIAQDYGVVWSNDGQQFLVYGSRGIDIYDAHTYTLIETIEVENRVSNMVVHPQKAEVAFVTQDSQLTILDLETHETRLMQEADYEWLFGLTYSPNGDYLALIYGNESEIHILDSQTGDKQMILHGRGSEFRQIVFSPDGRYLVALGTVGRVGGVSVNNESLSNQGAIVWDVKLGLPVASLHAPLDMVNWLTFGEDGKYIFITDSSGAIYVWDTTQFNLSAYRTYGNLLEGMYKGQLITDSEVGFWKSRYGIWQIDEDILLTFHNEPSPGFERWDIRKQNLQDSFTIQGLSIDDKESYATYILSPDNQQALRIISNKIQIIDLDTQSVSSEIPYHREFWNNLTFDAETSRLAINSQNGIIIWNVLNGEEINRIHNTSDNFPGIAAIEFAPVNVDRVVLAGQFNKQKGIFIWNLVEDDISRIGESNYGGAMSLDIDTQNHIIFASEDGSLRQIGIDDDDNLLLTEQAKISNDLYVRPHYLSTNIETVWTNDGNILIKDNRNQMIVIDGETGDRITELSGHIDTISDMVLSVDGSLLASIDYAGTLILWDASTWEIITKVYDIGASPYNISFSSDNRLLAIGVSGQIILWDTETQITLSILEDTGNVVEFSPDGTLLATIKDNGVALWGILQ